MTLNFVHIDTLSGTKEFELLQGDIANLPFRVDLLCISAFKNDYVPTKTSIIGQLHARGINIGALARNPYLDLKESLGVWISPPIKNTNFKQIVCIEILGNTKSFDDIIKNLFASLSILEIQKNQNATIAIPLLGSGDQGIDDNLVIDSLLNASIDFLNYSRYLTKILFVVRNEEKAAKLNNEMNQVLGRIKVNSPKGPLADILKRDLNHNIDLLLSINQKSTPYSDLKRILNSEFRPFEFGAISRKVLESIINDLNPKANDNLANNIKKMEELGVSQWIRSYMDLIRIFGNEAVHDRNKKILIPESVDEKDLEIGMYCMIKILDFYLNYKKIG